MYRGEKLPPPISTRARRAFLGEPLLEGGEFINRRRKIIDAIRAASSQPGMAARPTSAPVGGVPPVPPPPPQPLRPAPTERDLTGNQAQPVEDPRATKRSALAQQRQPRGDQVSTTDWNSSENDGDGESEVPSESEAEMNTIVSAPQPQPRVRQPLSILRPTVPQPQGQPQVTLPTISQFGPPISISQYPTGMGAPATNPMRFPPPHLLTPLMPRPAPTKRDLTGNLT